MEESGAFEDTFSQRERKIFCGMLYMQYELTNGWRNDGKEGNEERGANCWSFELNVHFVWRAQMVRSALGLRRVHATCSSNSVISFGSIDFTDSKYRVSDINNFGCNARCKEENK